MPIKCVPTRKHSYASTVVFLLTFNDSYVCAVMNVGDIVAVPMRGVGTCH